MKKAYQRTVARVAKILLLATTLLFFAFRLLTWVLIPVESFKCLVYSPEAVVSLFYDYGKSGNAAEDMLMDPLIVAGKRVVPAVLKEVVDKDMSLRRYAIGFLGIAGDKKAVPVLNTILADTSELDYIRADALESIYMLEPKSGIELAREHAARDDFLGSIAREIIDGTVILPDRTYADAFLGRHY